ncbi:MAG: hypothetical protein ACLU4N_11175 [Butyricimonas faecihominis]
MFNERINIDASYYKNKTKDALMPISLPWSGSFLRAGEYGKDWKTRMRVCDLGARDQTKGLFWMVTVNGSHTMDKLTNVSTALKSIEVAQSLGARPSLMFQEAVAVSVFMPCVRRIDPASGKEILLIARRVHV